MGPRVLVTHKRTIVSFLSIILFTFFAALAFVAGQTQKLKAVAPSAQQASQTSASDAGREKDDPQFKGMQYRLIGPFRGGRSLTASGVPGDP